MLALCYIKINRPLFTGKTFGIIHYMDILDDMGVSKLSAKVLFFLSELLL